MARLCSSSAASPRRWSAAILTWVTNTLKRARIGLVSQSFGQACLFNLMASALMFLRVIARWSEGI